MDEREGEEVSSETKGISGTEKRVSAEEVKDEKGAVPLSSETAGGWRHRRCVGSFSLHSLILLST